MFVVQYCFFYLCIDSDTVAYIMALDIATHVHTRSNDCGDINPDWEHARQSKSMLNNEPSGHHVHTPHPD